MTPSCREREVGGEGETALLLIILVAPGRVPRAVDTDVHLIVQRRRAAPSLVRMKAHSEGDGASALIVSERLVVTVAAVEEVDAIAGRERTEWRRRVPIVQRVAIDDEHIDFGVVRIWLL